MPIEIVRNDITKMQVDAIVHTTNSSMNGSGGVSAAVHRAAGPELAEACRALGSCGIGEVKLTQGYRLPARYVIHTVSPVWQGGSNGETGLLRSFYHQSLMLAKEQGCKSIAFPLIGSGAHAYPKELALRTATDSIGAFLLEHVPDNDLMVYLVLFSKESLLAGSKLYADIRQYIDDNYVQLHTDTRREQARLMYSAKLSAPDLLAPPCANMAEDTWNPKTIEDALSMMDEGFAGMVLRKIKEKGMKNADCYKKANIDKKLFSKIVNNPGYKPKKPTALALAIALELSLEETRELLMKAGLALSHSDKFDIIVEFFISKGIYDIFRINEALYDFDQMLLGGAVL